ALALAERAVAADSKDYRDHLWLGTVYWTAGQVDRAEPALVRARDLAPTAPEAWVTLVQFLVRPGHRARAGTEADPPRARAAGPAGAARPPADADDAAQDQRTGARRLASRNSGSSRRAAATIRDGLIGRQVAGPEDYYLAGQLHEAAGDWPRARQCYVG